MTRLPPLLMLAMIALAPGMLAQSLGDATSGVQAATEENTSVEASLDENDTVGSNDTTEDPLDDNGTTDVDETTDDLDTDAAQTDANLSDATDVNATTGDEVAHAAEDATDGDPVDDATDDGSSSDGTEGIPRQCRQGPHSGTLVCPLPPTCESLHEGAVACQPPRSCIRHGPAEVLCTLVPEDDHAAGQADANLLEPLRPRDAAPATVSTDVRASLRAHVDDALADYRAQLGDLRERYRAGVDELRETYREAKDQLRDAYRSCLEDEPEDLCRERATRQHSMLRVRLLGQREGLEASLVAEAEHRARDLCSSLEAHHLRALRQAGLDLGPRSTVPVATLPLFCR